MLRNLIRKIVFKIISYCEKRDKIFVITGSSVNGEAKPYLVRYLLLNNRFFSVYVHRFLRSDHDGPHDHPFPFFSYIVDGGYTERQYFYEGQLGRTWFDVEDRKREPGSLAFKFATDVHKVILDKEFTLEEKEQAPLSICLMGPKYREWGFWSGEEYTTVSGNIKLKAHWVLWTDFLGIKPDTEKRG